MSRDWILGSFGISVVSSSLTVHPHPQPAQEVSGRPEYWNREAQLALLAPRVCGRKRLELRPVRVLLLSHVAPYADQKHLSDVCQRADLRSSVAAGESSRRESDGLDGFPVRIPR